MAKRPSPYASTKSTYYCEIAGDFTYEFSKGVYVIPYRREYHTKVSRCVSYSDKVWVQGPRGGVKIIKDRNATCPDYGYVTKDEKIMKEFMWVKLQARSLENYT